MVYNIVHRVSTCKVYESLCSRRKTVKRRFPMAPKIKMSGANNVVDKELMKIVDDAISAARETGNSELNKRASALRKRSRTFKRNSSKFHNNSRRNPKSILEPENNERLQKLSADSTSILQEAQQLLMCARSVS